MSPSVDAEEISPEERRETALRYRERRTAELDAAAAKAVGGPVEAVGLFKRAAASTLAAIPIVGIFVLPLALLRNRRDGIPSSPMLAVDANSLNVIDPRGRAPSVSKSYPRAGVRIASVRRVLTEDEVRFEIAGEQDLVLYTSTLQTNPWSAQVIRALGGEVPEGIDPTAADPPGDAGFRR